MVNRLTRLGAVMLLLVAVVAQRRAAAFPGDCTCNFSGGGGVFFYQDDWTFMGQATGTTTFFEGRGWTYCQEDCIRYGLLVLAGNFCPTYGAGHKVQLLGNWSFQDPFNQIGGANSGGFSPFDPLWTFECS